MRIIHIGILLLTTILLTTCGSHYKPVESEPIEGLGDINQDGVAYSIADAVMFSNYFIFGMTAFPPGREDVATERSDINRDGTLSSVADLVYLIRIIVGDYLPENVPRVQPTTTTYTYSRGVVNVRGEMGAAAFVFDGDVDVELLAPNMEMKYVFDGEVTRALVFSLDGNTFSGDVVRGVNIVSSEWGSAYGGVVVTRVVRCENALSQNYPNPFNPATEIPFFLCESETVVLVVNNAAGQIVFQTGGFYSAGYHGIVFDGSDLPGGFYYYTLTAGSFSDTKRMQLLR